MIRCMMAIVMAAAVAAPAMAQTKGAAKATPTSTAAGATGTSNMDILRQKIKADKKLVIAENLGLTDAEGVKFWPVYDQYQKDLGQVNQQLATTIKAYADAYNKGPVPDATAKDLLNQATAADAAEAKIKADLVPKVLAVLPATKAARYIQIENKIRAAIRYELADNIPLVQ